jgi:hypothetical protein
MLRAAVAQAARDHWHALRLIAPNIDPRTLAAESVATTAAGLLGHPALWRVVHLAEALADRPHDARRLITASKLSADELPPLLRQLDALDKTCRAWTDAAYGRARQ